MSARAVKVRKTLDTYLLKLHPASERPHVRILTLDLAISRGETNIPYIRVVVEVARGSITPADKRSRLEGVAAACREYEGKKADRCEIEVTLREVDPEDHLQILPKAVKLRKPAEEMMHNRICLGLDRLFEMGSLRR